MLLNLLGKLCSWQLLDFLSVIRLQWTLLVWIRLLSSGKIGITLLLNETELINTKLLRNFLELVLLLQGLSEGLENHFLAHLGILLLDLIDLGL